MPQVLGTECQCDPQLLLKFLKTRFLMAVFLGAPTGSAPGSLGPEGRVASSRAGAGAAARLRDALGP